MLPFIFLKVLLQDLQSRYESPKQALETNSAAKVQDIRPSAFGGIIPVGHETTSFSYSPRICVAHENVSLSCSTYKFQCTAFLKFEFHE